MDSLVYNQVVSYSCKRVGVSQGIADSMINLTTKLGSYLCKLTGQFTRQYYMYREGEGGGGKGI